MNLDKIKSLAGEFSFTFDRMHGNGCVARFKRDYVIIDIWFDRMTVGVYLPNKPQKFFRDVSSDSLTELLANPEI